MKNNEKVTKFIDPTKMWQLLRFPTHKYFGLPKTEYDTIKLDCPPEKYAESLKKIPFVCNELLKSESLMEMLLAEYPYKHYSSKFLDANTIDEHNVPTGNPDQMGQTLKLDSAPLTTQPPITPNLEIVKKETLSILELSQIPEAPYCFLDMFLSVLKTPTGIDDPTMLGYFASTLANLISTNCKLILTKMNEQGLFQILTSNMDKIPMSDIIRNLLQGYVENKEEVAQIRGALIKCLYESLEKVEANESKGNGIAAFFKTMIECDIIELQLLHVEKLIELLKVTKEPLIKYICIDILIVYFTKIKDGDTAVNEIIIFKKAAEQLKSETNKMKVPIIFKLFVASFAIKEGPFKTPNKESVEVLAMMGEIVPSIYKEQSTSSVILTNILQFYTGCSKLDKQFIGQIFNEKLISCLADTNEKEKITAKFPVACELCLLLKKLKSDGMIGKLRAEIKKLYKLYREDSDRPLFNEQLSCNISKNDALKAYYESLRANLLSTITIEDNGEDLSINDIN
jgi:hypothetical protein